MNSGSQSAVGGSILIESTVMETLAKKQTETTTTLMTQIILLLTRLIQRLKADENGKPDLQLVSDWTYLESDLLSPPFMPASLDPLKHGTPISPGSLLKWNTPMATMAKGEMRVFETGATRDSDYTKYDYEGFLSPLVLKRYAQYLHKHRIQADGQQRASDNWQKGIPLDTYMKSAWRHFMDWWSGHRSAMTIHNEDFEDAICALIFNASGYLFEHLKTQERKKF